MPSHLETHLTPAAVPEDTVRPADRNVSYARSAALRIGRPAVARLVLGVTLLSCGAASAEQAAARATGGRRLAGRIDAGEEHTCAIVDDDTVRCWGDGFLGRLGYGNTNDIGNDENPAAAGAVDLGAGRTATAIAAGGDHTCAILDNGTVRCWGHGLSGQLGYGNTDDIGDDETPGSVGPVDLGAGRTATAITAGGRHTCVILDNATVRCWGSNFNGQIGNPNETGVGDDETPGSVAVVDLGVGRTAKVIAAGGEHTCAILDNSSLRCWGSGTLGSLGYANPDDIGDDETPGSVGPVDVGAGRTAAAVTAGAAHTCAILDDDTVRCWGYNVAGQLGYGHTDVIGNDETPGSVGTVDLGAGRTARDIAAGAFHTCASLDDGSVRCWGMGTMGQIGYANTDIIGDDELPTAVGFVDVGVLRKQTITAGDYHTCAVLANGRVRCWGEGLSGKPGYANTDTIGDDETPKSVGPIVLGGLVQ